MRGRDRRTILQRIFVDQNTEPIMCAYIISMSVLCEIHGNFQKYSFSIFLMFSCHSLFLGNLT